jgi:predicted RNA binding protein YcfA (HicA-like mRNA interferase family)
LGRLRVHSGPDVIKILEYHGFVQVRQRGSHVSLQRRAAGTTRTVIVPLHAELGVGTLLSILRQSGLSREIFEVG